MGPTAPGAPDESAEYQLNMTVKLQNISSKSAEYQQSAHNIISY